MMNALNDARRSLRRSPGFVLLVVGMLAIGIGLNAAIFAVVDSVLLRPLGYHDANRIVALQTRFLQENRTVPRLGGGDYVDLTQSVIGIEAAAYYNSGSGAVQANGQSAMVPLAYVSPRFGQVLGVEPVAGHLFLDSPTASSNQALVSAGFARDHFGSPHAAIGQYLRGEGGLYTVVGVLPDAFQFPGSTRVWFQQPTQPENLNRTSYNDMAVAKRRAGVSAGVLNAELQTFSHRLQQSFPEDRLKSIEAVPLQEELVGKVAGTLHLLVGSVLIVLLIVCANITHLQLVRATRGMRENAVRSALGASRATLAARAIVEAGLLSIAGTVAAVLLAAPALRLLLHLAPADLPRLQEVHLSWRVPAVCLLLSFLLMAATALLPVWRSWRTEPSTAMRHDGARGLESRGATRLRNGMLAVQIALTLVLSVAAVLLARELTARSREDLGFNMEHLYTLDANTLSTAPQASTTASADTAAAEQAQASAQTSNLLHLRDSLDILRATPGVVAAEAIRGAPLGFDSSDVSYAIEGKHVFTATAVLPDADIHPVTPGALALLGVPVLRGRALTEHDTLTSPPVLLINQTLAGQQFHGADPIGKRIMCGFDSEGQWWTIVGVVGDVRNLPGAPASANFYVPVAQHPAVASGMQLLVRTAPGSQISEEALRKRIAAAQPEIAITATTMAENLTEAQRDLRFRTLLFQSFAAVSILLAMLGMYGATAYTVAQRQFEFGLRMALGATRAQVVSRVLRASLLTALTGAAAGLVLYAALQRVAAAWLGAAAGDLFMTGIATTGVVLLAMLAAALPARRASTVDPMRALRNE